MVNLIKFIVKFYYYCVIIEPLAPFGIVTGICIRVAKVDAWFAEADLLFLFVFVGCGKFVLSTPPLLAVGHILEVDVVEYDIFCIRVVCFEIG